MTNPHTSEDYSRAVDAIRDEMAAAHDDINIAMMGDIMTALLEVRPEIAPSLTAKGKSLKGAYDALTGEARKRAGGRGGYAIGPGNLGVLFDTVGRYYGFEAPEASWPGVMARLYGGAPTPTPEPEPAAALDDLSLDALLGGI